jgi:acyl carrier protein
MTLLSRENITPRIKTIISEHLDVKFSDIAEQDSICDDLGADSLDYVGLWMSCEDEFGIDIGDEDADGVTTVGELIDLILSAGPVA